MATPPPILCALSASVRPDSPGHRVDFCGDRSAVGCLVSPECRRPPVPATQQDNDGRHEERSDQERVHEHAQCDAIADLLDLPATAGAPGDCKDREASGEDD